MRSTQELIAELDEESSKHRYVAIVVAFEIGPVFVKAVDAHRLQTLNEAVDSGGKPIGLIVADRAQGKLGVTTKIYPENLHQEQWLVYLVGLTDSFRGLLIAGFGVLPYETKD